MQWTTEYTQMSGAMVINEILTCLDSIVRMVFDYVGPEL